MSDFTPAMSIWLSAQRLPISDSRLQVGDIFTINGIYRRRSLWGWLAGEKLELQPLIATEVLEGYTKYEPYRSEQLAGKSRDERRPPRYDAPGEMQRVMEVYDLRLSIEDQLNEHRAMHLPKRAPQ